MDLDNDKEFASEVSAFSAILSTIVDWSAPYKEKAEYILANVDRVELEEFLSWFADQD